MDVSPDKELIMTEQDNLIAAAPAMLAALRAVAEAFSYVGPSALPSDAAVDWESVAEQVDLAIYHAVNIGVQKEATQ